MEAPPKLFKPNSTTGKYIIVLAPDRDYTIFYTVEDSVVQTEHIFIPEESAYQEIERSIGLKPIELQGFQVDAPEPSNQTEQPKETPPAETAEDTPKIEIEPEVAGSKDLVGVAALFGQLQ